MHIVRTRFGRDIVAEVGIPAHLTSKKALVICSGVPSVPSKKHLITFFARKGYWVIFPRYRGSWESGGVFLKKSPEQDIIDVLNAFLKGFTDLWNGEVYTPQVSIYHILAISFGGPAGILLSRDKRIGKVIALSPVVDWTAPSKAEPLDWLEQFMHNAFGDWYRFSKREWRKLAYGTFYNPTAHTDKIDGSKLLIIHAKDDESVLYRPVERFAKKVGATLKLYKRGGHLSTNFLLKQSVFKQVDRFLKKN